MCVVCMYVCNTESCKKLSKFSGGVCMYVCLYVGVYVIEKCIFQSPTHRIFFSCYRICIINNIKNIHTGVQLQFDSCCLFLECSPASVLPEAVAVCLCEPNGPWLSFGTKVQIPSLSCAGCSRSSWLNFSLVFWCAMFSFLTSRHQSSILSSNVINNLRLCLMIDVWEAFYKLH